MKKIKIKRVLLAAAMLAGAGMYAQSNEPTPVHIVYCKATISSAEHEDYISVTLPPTDGYYDTNGNPITYWDVGNVASGGVADSWHQKGGPGRFVARNESSRGAYIYVMSTGMLMPYMSFGGYYNNSFSFNGYTSHNTQPVYVNGDHNMHPTASLVRWRKLGIEGDTVAYHLAFTTDVVAKVPTWHSLNYVYTSFYEPDSGRSYYRFESVNPNNEFGGECIAGYMGYVEAGDYIPFDLKFYAPHNRNSGDSLFFTFCVEASEFPLWDHGRAVE